MTSATSSRSRALESSAAWKIPCITASTGNLTLSGEQTVDGISLVTGDRVLCKDQTDTTEIGIYKVDSSTWQREPDWDNGVDIQEGTMVPVSRGSTNSDTYWRITNTGTITVDTTSITMAQGLADIAIAATVTTTDESSDTTCFPTFVTAATGDLAQKTDTVLTYNSSTGVLGANGIAFPSTHVANADANTLDEYEEGEWTPVLEGGGNAAAASPAVGRYERMGRLVNFRFRMTITSLDSATGAATITGLPFTSSSTSSTHGSAHFGNGLLLNIVIKNSISGLITPSTAYIALKLWDLAAGTSNMTAEEVSATGDLFCSGQYML